MHIILKFVFIIIVFGAGDVICMQGNGISAIDKLENENKNLKQTIVEIYNITNNPGQNNNQEVIFSTDVDTIYAQIKKKPEEIITTVQNIVNANNHYQLSLTSSATKILSLESKIEQLNKSSEENQVKQLNKSISKFDTTNMELNNTTIDLKKESRQDSEKIDLDNLMKSVQSLKEQKTELEQKVIQFEAENKNQEQELEELKKKHNQEHEKLEAESKRLILQVENKKAELEKLTLEIENKQVEKEGLLGNIDCLLEEKEKHREIMEFERIQYEFKSKVDTNRRMTSALAQENFLFVHPNVSNNSSVVIPGDEESPFYCQSYSKESYLNQCDHKESFHEIMIEYPKEDFQATMRNDGDLKIIKNTNEIGVQTMGNSYLSRSANQYYYSGDNLKNTNFKALKRCPYHRKCLFCKKLDKRVKKKFIKRKKWIKRAIKKKKKFRLKNLVFLEKKKFIQKKLSNTNVKKLSNVPPKKLF